MGLTPIIVSLGMLLRTDGIGIPVSGYSDLVRQRFPDAPPMPNPWADFVDHPPPEYAFADASSFSPNYVPDALAFTETLASWILPKQVIVLTGGDSYRRRQESFSKLSADSIEDFCKYHGYTLAFLDELEYEKPLKYGGVEYHVIWHRVFALPAVRKRWPKAKYVVWLDDDILIPYAETNMLNHYINLMELDPEWEMTYGEEGGNYVLNSGMFFMKARDFAYNTYQAILEIGLENDHYLAHKFGHEQEAIIKLRERGNLQSSIRVIPHRDGVYNFNNFARDCGHDLEGTKARVGDAFVHFTGLGHERRVELMTRLIETVQEWRSKMPKDFTLPPPTNRNAIE